jgi:hypothetical protein
MTNFYKTKLTDKEICKESEYIKKKICSQNFLHYLAFQPFDFERTWWRLFQKRVVRTRTNFFLNVLAFFIFQSFSFSSSILTGLSFVGSTSPSHCADRIVSASALPWFNRYMCYWNLQFLNNESIIQIKVLLPQA